MRVLCDSHLWKQEKREWWQRVDWAGLGLVTWSLVLYIHTLAPGVLPSDHGELQFKVYTLDPVHPPGYPLYLLMGRLWSTFVPVGSVAYRMNLFSAVCAAAAVWFLYKFICLFVHAWIPGVVGAGVLAFSPLFWTHAITTNTYALNTLLFIALLYLWLSAYDRRLPLWCVAFVFGLGLAHHRLVVVSAPAFLLVTFIARKRMLPSIRAGLLSALALLLPLTLYGLLIWQGVWPLSTLWRHVFISGGAVYPVQELGAVFERLTRSVWPWLCQDFGLLFTHIGIASLIALLWLPLEAHGSTRQSRRRCLAWLLMGLLLSHLVFYSLVRIEPDDRRYFVPAYAMVAVGVGIAVAYVRTGLSRWLKRSDAVVSVALILPVLVAYHHLPEMAQCQDDYFDRITRDALKAMEQDAILITHWGYVMPFYYYQAVEGWRPDVRVLMMGPGVDRDQTVAWIKAGHPVYFREGTFGLDWPGSGYVWIDMNVGGLYRALPEVPTVARWIPGSYASPLQAVGLSAWPLQPDTLVTLCTLWDAGQVEQEEVNLSARLVDDHGQVWGQWSAFLSRLRLVRVSDASLQVNLFFVIPPAVPPGEYALELRLSQDDALLNSTHLREIPIAAREQPLAPQRLVVSDWINDPESLSRGLRLIAANRPGSRFTENTLITLGLFWQVGADPVSPSLSLSLLSQQQSWILIEREPLLKEALASRLPAGTLLESKHGLTFANVPPGRYHVEVAVDTGTGKDIYDLGRIEVTARRRVYRVPAISNPVRAVLGGEIEFLGYDLQPEVGRPGEEVALTLYWRSLTQPTGNYKVFTHLMNGWGELAAQRDGLPLEGTVLTSQWSPREVITDKYAILVPSDLAEGVYQLEVGMYRPDSGERLPAVDARGNRWLHDKIVLQQVEIRRD
jgi:hypothetical protein